LYCIRQGVAKRFTRSALNDIVSDYIRRKFHRVIQNLRIIQSIVGAFSQKRLSRIQNLKGNMPSA
jgi:hypothetical protein